MTFLDLLKAFNDRLWGDWLMYLLLGVGLLYTVATGAVQVRHFGRVMKECIIRPLTKSGTEADEGFITSFQALCTALASCVGSGNIVGVSTAVLTGGIGALFWMWVAAFFGMATKYGEIILGMLFRHHTPQNNVLGGPFYYIADGLHLKMLAKITAFFMVVQIVGGNFIQSNTLAGVLHHSFSLPPFLSGVILTALVMLVTLGGLKRLARIAVRLVPFMACAYLFGGFIVLIARAPALPGVFSRIFTRAFSLQAAAGGAAGSMLKLAMSKGIARGLYSNEAGEGSAAVIHSAAQVDHPARQAMTGIAEVFLDTFVICTFTGLVLGVTGFDTVPVSGSVAAAKAFASVWSPLEWLVIGCLLLFSFTTLISQWYFGFVGLNYLWGFGPADKFKYCFPFFCIIGACLKIETVWTLQDIALGLLTVPNLIALILLVPLVRQSTKEFFR